MYEQLQEEAAALNVVIKETYLPGRLKGLYGENEILINENIETSIEKTCILAEELGHHHYTVGDIIDQSKIMNIKQEKLTRRWAFRKLIPLDGFLYAFNHGCRSRYEIAELLNVTEHFLTESLNYYKERYGLFVRIDDLHVLFLDPLSIHKQL
ncbi:ImmA/IrrE family metallo-endopeptidase [Virgibacillus pantothenticus]|uniref:ImmA/IrrE family metallo-endopeptidase n=1 Tax=Virgibacillus pantothenticus TaxID=1473 RepID=UPI000985523B|nr:ImmA/IrrE family metallo-endopeptidase [Virgibacillus pantothenticus]